MPNIEIKKTYAKCKDYYIHVTPKLSSFVVFSRKCVRVIHKAKTLFARLLQYFLFHQSMGGKRLATNGIDYSPSMGSSYVVRTMYLHYISQLFYILDTQSASTAILECCCPNIRPSQSSILWKRPGGYPLILPGQIKMPHKSSVNYPIRISSEPCPPSQILNFS